LAPISPDELWQRATTRWAEITAISPDLTPAVVLQQRLLQLIIGASCELDQRPPGSLTPDAMVDKWRRGVPALRNEVVPIPENLRKLLPGLCMALAEGGAADSALHILDAILDERIDAESLLSVSLARNHEAIRTSSLHMGLSPDLVWLIGELGSCPLAHHLQIQLLGEWGRVQFSSAGDGKVHPTPFWDHGYCPCCGSWPAFIEAQPGSRSLRCSFCAFAWDLQSHRCIYCGNSGKDFVSATPDASRQRHLELCAQCGNYTKVIEVPEPTPFPLLAIEDLASMDLDQGAMGREYRRPELCDLNSVEPFKSPC
jgi:formate dehydrogenase maturation protein FdhE